MSKINVSGVARLATLHTIHTVGQMDETREEHLTLHLI